MEMHIDNYKYYNKILDIDVNNLRSYDISINCNMMKDMNGTYIEEKNFIEENTFYKFTDINNALSKLNINLSHKPNELLPFLPRVTYYPLCIICIEICIGRVLWIKCVTNILRHLTAQGDL